MVNAIGGMGNTVILALSRRAYQVPLQHTCLQHIRVQYTHHVAATDLGEKATAAAAQVGDKLLLKACLHNGRLKVQQSSLSPSPSIKYHRVLLPAQATHPRTT